jgi:hypothetical protein
MISASEVKFHQTASTSSIQQTSTTTDVHHGHKKAKAHVDPSEAIVVGHGAEALLARKADSARARVLENVRDHHQQRGTAEKKATHHVAGYRRREKRRAFFGFGNSEDDDFSVFSHAAYADPANDEDGAAVYDGSLPTREEVDERIE